MGDNDTSACREGAKALTLEEAPMARAKGMMVRFILLLGLFTKCWIRRKTGGSMDLLLLLLLA